ncbi:MAG TPA: hypothetical protein VFI96_07525, partial [Longimicrobiaceae bacterium]|nr:hypothetical protein [Longimicrobiaceae bacterium]
VESVAYEMLGPPRLSKLLYEAAVLGRLAGGELQRAAELDPEEGVLGPEHGSRSDLEAVQGSARLRPGALAAWVFRHEDRGERIKR